MISAKVRRVNPMGYLHMVIKLKTRGKIKLINIARESVYPMIFRALPPLTTIDNPQRRDMQEYYTYSYTFM